MSLIKLWFVPFIAFFMASGCGQDQEVSELDWWPPKKYDETTNLYIHSFDGTPLISRLYRPKEKYFPGQRPAIIFANSWTLDEKEYIQQAKKFASKGYIVLSYATRGFGRSEGMVSAAGPNDIKDVSSIIDWLENYTIIDVDRIGMIGVSYGGGIGLLALAQDKRLFTSIGLSSWADLEKALYGDDTARKIWINILLASGELTGNIDPEFHQMYKNLREQTNVQETRDWARARSVAHMVDAINKKGSPVLLANSYRDNLFPPNQALDFFGKLTVPKKMMMNRGIHATAEIPGIFGLDDEIWENVHSWLDGWFGLETRNKYLQDFPYTFQVGNGHESYESMPTALSKKEKWSLEPVNEIKTSNSNFNFSSDRDGLFVESGWDSGASTGIPILSSVLDSHTPIKVKKWLPLVNKKYGALYYSDNLSEELAVRGVPKINFLAKPMSKDIQAVAYLYEVDWRGVGTLVSHGVKTYRNLEVGADISITVDMATIAYDIQKGRKLALVIDTYDALYDRPLENQFGFQVIHDGESRLKLFIPEP